MGNRAKKLGYKLGMFGGAACMLAVGLALKLPSWVAACSAMACIVGFGYRLTKVEETEDQERKRRDRRAGVNPQRLFATVVSRVGEDAFKVKVRKYFGRWSFEVSQTVSIVKVPEGLREPGSIGVAVVNRNGRIVRLEPAGVGA
jgi:hypothetical protein